MDPAARPFQPTGPIRLTMPDLMSIAEAYPLLRELARLEEVKAPGMSHESAVFAILDHLQEALDLDGALYGPRGVQDTITMIRGWFEERIAAGGL